MNLQTRIESYKEEMIKDLQRLIAHNSIQGEPAPGAPNGLAVAQCLEEAIDIAQGMGFATQNIDGWAGEVSFGDSPEYVAVLGHLDIVPAGNDWTYDPFKGEVDDGKLYGRGTNDDKGPLLAALYALKALKDEQVQLGSTVKIIMGTCEETGGPDIEHYLKTNEQPKAGFTPDASFPVINAEKGILNFTLTKKLKTSEIKILELAGGNASNMVPDKAKVVYLIGETESQMVLKGLSAHGSTPELGKNAIFKLFRRMRQLDKRLAKDLDFLLEAFADSNGEHLGIGLVDEASGQLTINPGVLRFSEGVMTLEVNLRIPVTFTDQDVKDRLRLKFAGSGFDITFGEFTEPLYYPEDLPMINSLMEVYRRVTGDQEAKPMAIGGGTYAKAMDNVVAFGPGLPGRQDVDHIADEYIFIEDLMTWTNLYAEAILALSHIK